MAKGEGFAHMWDPKLRPSEPDPATQEAWGLGI